MSSTDRFEVIEAVYRFAAAIDHRDWQAYRDVFTDEILIDYSSYRTDSIGTMTAEAWVARAVRLFPGLDASQHTISNSLVTFDGDEATCKSYVRAEHALDGDLFTLGGHYTHGLVPRPDGWRINRVALRVAWTQGDQALLDRARARAAVQ
jgi:ketosteroid isomerase-like protein